MFIASWPTVTATASANTPWPWRRCSRQARSSDVLPALSHGAELGRVDGAVELIGINRRPLACSARKIQPETNFRLERPLVAPGRELPVFARLEKDAVETVAAKRIDIGGRLDLRPAAHFVLGLLNNVQERIASCEGGGVF